MKISFLLLGISLQSKKAGWSLAGGAAIDPNGRTIWIADGHRDDGKRFVVRANEKLTAFLELLPAKQFCPGQEIHRNP